VLAHGCVSLGTAITGMYFAYGCPKSYRLAARTDDRQDEPVVYASFRGSDLLVCVTSERVQLWSGGQHRIKIGELVRDEDAIKQHGRNMRAWWCPAKRVIVVAVSSLRSRYEETASFGGQYKDDTKDTG